MTNKLPAQKPRDIIDTLFDLLRPGRELPSSSLIRDALLDSSDERIRLEGMHETAHARAMDPLVPEADAEAASNEAAALDRKITRLEHAEEHLRELLERAYASENRAELNKSAAAARQAVTDVHSRFLGRWPALVAELVDLLTAVKDTRAFVRDVNNRLRAIGEPIIDLPAPVGQQTAGRGEVIIDKERVSRIVSEDDGRVLSDEIIARAQPQPDGRYRLKYEDQHFYGRFAIEREFDQVTFLPAVPSKSVTDILQAVRLPGHWPPRSGTWSGNNTPDPVREAQAGGTEDSRAAAHVRLVPVRVPVFADAVEIDLTDAQADAPVAND